MYRCVNARCTGFCSEGERNAIADRAVKKGLISRVIGAEEGIEGSEIAERFGKKSLFVLSTISLSPGAAGVPFSVPFYGARYSMLGR